MVTSHQLNKRSSSAAGSLASPAPVRLDDAVTVGARRVAAALTDPSGARSRDQWLGVVGDCQALINTLTAVQDTAIAEAARRESVWCEDGTLAESVHGYGRVCLDAADLIAPVIGASHPQAQRRVEQAVRLAAGRAPVPAETNDLPEASGLGGLHQAMVAGQLDAYRAGVVAFELEVAPADVADAVVTALNGHLDDDATTLRRRTRVLLQRISPDLVRERAKKARAGTGLRRWVAEPGVEEWHGTFPSEDAATAWAAIDKLAHDLVAAGTCTNIEQARGKALTDLVTGNATIDIQLMLTVPATTAGADRAATSTAGDAAPPTTQVEGQVPSSEAPAVEQVAVQTSADDAPASSTGRDDRAAATTAADSTPAVEHVAVHTSANEAPALCTTVAARPCLEPDDAAPALSTTHTDQARLGPADEPPSSTTSSMEDLPKTTAGSRANPQDDDLVEVQGARPSEPLLVRRRWLRDHLATKPSHSTRGTKRAGPPFVPCDPLTGARLDPDDHLATHAYRPGAKLTALVKARDGRCRFPGCSVAARFCDLDHVRPWPTGPTTASNLLTLCRRHHRIKQRPGWRLRLAPDGTTTWTDPTGRVRTTTPLDALKSLVLTVDPVHERPAPPPDTEMTAAAPAWSALETHLQLRLEHHPHPHREQHLRPPPTHRRCTSADDLRAGLARRRASAAMPEAPPF